MIEAGLSGYEASLLFAVIAPAATPIAIVTRLSREIGDIMATSAVQDVLVAQAIHAKSSTSDQLRERVIKEIELGRAIASKAGIKPE